MRVRKDGRIGLSRLYTIFDVRDEEALHYNANKVADLCSTEEVEVSFARLLPGDEIDSRTYDQCEANSFVVTGIVSYLTGSAAPEVPKGGWTVARPNELHGYRNSGEWPVHLLLFMPMSRELPDSLQSEIRQRVFRTPAQNKEITRVYQTHCSRGFQHVLSPGKTHKLDYAKTTVVFVVDGRIMTLMAGDKVSLDGGEGVLVRKSVIELVGVAGSSVVAVMATRP